MSHELLLICGTPAESARARRLRLVRHAARRVPGASDGVEIVDLPTATAALVETTPIGGSCAEIGKDGDGSLHLTVAATQAGLDVAATERRDGHLAGSEAGHVGIRIRPDGAVRVTTDGMATLPSYWAQHEGELLVSTHLASLVSLGLPAMADEQGVLEYLVMLHPLQDRTTLHDARLLPPGGLLEWSPSRAARLTARPLFVPSTDRFSDREAIATFGEVWRKVIGDTIDRASAGRPSLGLSGGLDSRAIAVAAAEHGFRPLSYTYGTSSNREVHTATRVARRLGLPHLQIPVTDDRLLRRAPEIVERLDGAHSPAEMYEAWFDDMLASFTDVVINGLAGGPLWGDDKAVGLIGYEAVAASQWKRYSSSVNSVRPYLGPGVQDDLAARMRDGICESMQPWDFTERADMAIFWKLSNRQLRWGNMLFNGLRRSGIRLEAPFLDSRVLRFTAALTPEQRLNGNLYLQAHRELFRATDHIGRSDDGNSPRGLNHVYWSGETSLLSQLSRLTMRHPLSGSRRAFRRAIHSGAGRVRTATAISGPANALDERADVFPADLWVRTRRTYRERLAGLLEAAPAYDLLSPDSVAQATQALRRGESTTPALVLAKIATANLWLADYGTRANDVSRLAHE